MAKADHIKALVRSHSEGDDSRFYAVALQVAAQAARQGQGRFAQELRKLVDEAKARSSAIESGAGPTPTPIAQPRGELAGLLSAAYPRTRVADMALDSETHRRVKRVVLEQRQRTALRSHGLEPLRKLLLVGPPGTGKTMTASALAGELGIPLFTIQLHGLITKYMGETAAKLRLVFDAIQSTRGVYLFDEFDALGGERSVSNEVGEIRRVLNSFLQFLEADHSDSLIVAATNHVNLLDRALFRRFDSVIEYDLPSEEIAVRIMEARLSLLDTSSVDWTAAASAAEGLSHAELVHACEQAAKDAILENTMAVKDQELITSLKDRRAARA